MEVIFSQKRQAPRIATAVPVEFELGHGVTRDFSTSGVCFATSASLKAGEPLQFAVFLEPEGEDEAVTLQCEGTVRRVQQESDHNVVFVALESFWFAPPSPVHPQTNRALPGSLKLPIAATDGPGPQFEDPLLTGISHPTKKRPSRSV